MNDFEKLCREVYYTKRNVFEYDGKYYHLVYLNRRSKGHLITYAVQAERVDDGQHWINVGEPVSVS